jgi:hypothetical protein
VVGLLFVCCCAQRARGRAPRRDHLPRSVY